MRVPTKFLCLLLGLLALLSASGCRQAQKPVPLLRLGHAPHDHHSPLYIAAMNPGYMKSHGGIYLKEIVFRQEYELIDHDRTLARVSIDATAGGNELIRRLSEGLFDMSFGGVPAMLGFIDQGSRFKIVAPVMSEGAGLVVQRALPAGNWQDFLDYIRQSPRPVKIGYKIAVSAQNLILAQAMQESGVACSDDPQDTSAKVLLVNLFGAQNLIPAMENGLIDGFVTMQPYIAMAEERGTGKAVAMLQELPPAGKWQGAPCCALAASDDYVASNPQVVQAMITLNLRAIALLNMEPARSAEQIARWLDTPAAVEMKSIPTIRFLQDYGKDWERGLALWVDDMIKNGMLKGRVKEASANGRLDEVIYNRELFDKAKKNL